MHIVPLMIFNCFDSQKTDIMFFVTAENFTLDLTGAKATAGNSKQGGRGLVMGQ